MFCLWSINKNSFIDRFNKMAGGVTGHAEKLRLVRTPTAKKTLFINKEQ